MIELIALTALCSLASVVMSALCLRHAKRSAWLASMTLEKLKRIDAEYAVLGIRGKHLHTPEQAAL